MALIYEFDRSLSAHQK